MTQQMQQHTYPNGLTLVGEKLDHVRSATVYIMVPAGFVHEPPDKLGLAGVLAEMLGRGAGPRDSKTLALDLDNLGVDGSEGAGAINITLSGGMLARNIPKVLPIYADILRRPWLPEDELAPAVELSLQDLQGLDDSPSDLTFLELRQRFYPSPLNRNQYGTAKSLEAITPKDVKDYHAARFRPNGMIVSVAGSIDFDAIRDQVGDLFGDMDGVANEAVADANHSRTSSHIVKETNQTQIALAMPTAHFNSPDFYLARGIINVLSGGMSSRLFTEVREKRGLCYSVSASYDQVRDRAALVCYAGTENKRAQQTLDVMIDVLNSLKQGISEDELDRVKAGLKTSLIMQQESTAARAGAMATDWFYLKRLRAIAEIQQAIDSLTPHKLQEFLERSPLKDFTLVTLGPEALVLPVG
jgi:predicted Zn-dependent peptidase